MTTSDYPFAEAQEARDALAEVQRFWRQVRWIVAPAPAVAVIVLRPVVVDTTAGRVVTGLAVSVGIVAVNVYARRELMIDDLAHATRFSGLLHVLDATITCGVVALFIMSSPGSALFILLFIPILQFALIHQIRGLGWALLGTSVAYITFEASAASLHVRPMPWDLIAWHLALLIGGSALAGALGQVLGRHITSLRRAHEAVRRQALHDPLTGLPNRALFFERVRQAIARQQRTGIPFAVLFVDLDDLKAVNDSYGHRVGDRLLREVAGRLRRSLRAADTPARLGGDEFAAVLEDTGARDDIDDLGQRLVNTLRQPIHTGGLELPVSVSMGAVVSGGGESASELVRRADIAMYQAKAAGKGRIVRFDSATHGVHIEPSMLADPVNALKHTALRVLYEPAVDLKTRRLRGLHARLAWDHDEHGVIGHDEILRVAAQAHWRTALGTWFIERVQQDLTHVLARDATALASLYIALPLVGPPPWKVRGQAPLTWLHTLALPTECLHLEITRNTVRQDDVVLGCELRLLSNHGVRCILGGFGSSTTSIAQLYELPTNTVELDESLAGNLERAALVAGTVSLAQKLNISVIAVAGATADVDHLTRLGCNLGRGPALLPAVSAEGLGPLLGSTDDLHSPTFT